MAQKMVRLSKMLQHIGTHHQIMPAIIGEVGLIKINLPERRILQAVQPQILKIGEDHLRTGFAAKLAGISVTAAEIEHAGFRADLDAAGLQPVERIARLQFKKGVRVLFIIEM